MAAFVSQVTASRASTPDGEIEELWGLDGVRMRLEQLQQQAGWNV